MTSATGTALDQLTATRKTQLAPIAVPFADPVQPLPVDGNGKPFLVSIAAAPTLAATLKDWFPSMASAPSEGAEGMLFVDALALAGAQALYVNAASPLPVAQLATVAGASLDPARFGPDPIPAGGAILIAGTVDLSAVFAWLQDALGVASLFPNLPATNIAVDVRVDLSSGMPTITLGVPIGVGLGDLKSIRIEIVSPLCPWPVNSGGVPDDPRTAQLKLAISAAQLRLLGTIALGQDTLDVSAAIVRGGPIIATATFTDTPNLGQFTSGTGLPQLSHDTSVEVSLMLGASDGALSLKGLGIAATTSYWPLLDNLLTLDAVSVALNVFDPLQSNRSILATLSAEASIGGLHLTGTGSYPIGTFGLAMDDLPGASVGGLLSGLGVHSDALGSLAITDCSLSYDPQLKAFTAQVACDGTLSLDMFELDHITLYLQHATDTTASLDARCKIGGVSLAADVIYHSAGGAADWTVNASAADPNGIPVGAALAELASHCGISLPGFVQRIAVETFAVTYESANKHAVLDLGGTIDIGAGYGIGVTMESSVDLTGTLTIAGAHTLALDYKHGTIDAHWPAVVGSDTLSIGDLLGLSALSGCLLTTVDLSYVEAS